MPIFEYQITYREAFSAEPEDVYLNKYGAEGWELVHKRDVYVYYWKRVV